jgi:uncharacterized protein (TIGR01244 family)
MKTRELNEEAAGKERLQPPAGRSDHILNGRQELIDPFSPGGLMQRILLTLTALSLATTGYTDEKPAPRLEKSPLGSMPNSSAFADIHFGGQPSKADLAEAKKKGIKSVLNLRTAGETDLDEGPLVKELGLKYYHVPFQGAAALTDEVFEKTRSILNDKNARPLLLHCGSANRVGAIWLAHRVLDHKVPYEDALKEAKAIGLQTPGLVEKAKSYVERNKK